MATALAGEAFTPLQLTGVALVLAGIWFGTTTFSLPQPALWGRTSMLPVATS